MARGRTRRFFRKAGRPLRPLEWGGFTREVNIALGTQDAEWIIPPAAVADLHEPTLVRTLINYAIGVTLTSDVPDIGALGIIRYSGDPGSSAVPAERPDPLTDPAADWVFHTYIPVASRVGTQQTIHPGQHIIDISSMRKLTNHEGLLYVCDAGSSVQFALALGVRYLVKQ